MNFVAVMQSNFAPDTNRDRLRNACDRDMEKRIRTQMFGNADSTFKASVLRNRYMLRPDPDCMRVIFQSFRAFDKIHAR